MGWENIIWWCIVGAVMSPIWGSLLWFICEGYIRPARIPKEEIEALAEEMRRRNPTDPEDAAFTEEQAAWYRSETFEQGKWRRVRRHLDKISSEL